MRIKSLKPSLGRDLYGEIECEHCGSVEQLSGGYDDAHWHRNVLPAFHCSTCQMNRTGELPSQEVTARNRANGVNGI